MDADSFQGKHLLFAVHDVAGEGVYDGLNELATEEVRLAEIFRERGREDLSKCVIEGRKILETVFPSWARMLFLKSTVFRQPFHGAREDI